LCARRFLFKRVQSGRALRSPKSSPNCSNEFETRVSNVLDRGCRGRTRRASWLKVSGLDRIGWAGLLVDPVWLSVCPAPQRPPARNWPRRPPRARRPNHRPSGPRASGPTLSDPELCVGEEDKTIMYFPSDYEVTNGNRRDRAPARATGATPLLAQSRSGAPRRTPARQQTILRPEILTTCLMPPPPPATRHVLVDLAATRFGSTTSCGL